MTKSKVVVFAISVLLALSACSAANTATTLDEPTASSLVNEGAENVATTVAAIQEEILALSIALDSSDAAETLQDSWNDLNTALTSAITSIDDEGMIEGSEVESEIDAFQQDLDALGDGVQPELTAAWNALKNHLESIFS